MKKTSLLLVVLGLMPVAALAHSGAGHVTGFHTGFAHPFSGADHLLAMLAVGLWASQLGGRAVWGVPTAFVSLMLIGGYLGMAGVALPLVEVGILGSVMVLGALVAGAVRVPMLVSVLLVGFFAIFHGHAHGAEMLSLQDAYSYSLGFALATALLHAAGVVSGMYLERLLKQSFTRFAGLAIVVSGIYLSMA